MNELFYDTYALIELYRANPAFSAYASGRMHVTLLNLFEFNVFLLRTSDERSAQHWLERLSPFIEELDGETIAVAARLKHARKELSMADCIGYVVAQRLTIPFLTGDKAFKGMKGVEWVH